ncbi:MAG: hypothetical protein U0360_06845 [Dehalococcoidia bacterium]
MTSPSDARALLNRAARLAGVPRTIAGSTLRELVLVCTALAAEGGSIEALAEEIASASIGAKRSLAALTAFDEDND